MDEVYRTADPGGRREAVFEGDRRARVFVLDASAVRAVSDLLELLSELPSTPTPVAEVTRERAGELAGMLPAGGAGAHPQGAVEVDARTLVSAAALLRLLGQMESTPPVVAEDAREWSDDLWERMAREPVHGVQGRD